MLTSSSQRHRCALGCGLLALLVVAGLLLRPGEAPAPVVGAEVVVLFSSHDECEYRTFAAPPGSCRFVDLVNCDRATLSPARTVVVTGHSLPPDEYLHTTAKQLAKAIACLRPDLVVLDTCYGFSSRILEAMQARGLPGRGGGRRWPSRAAWRWCAGIRPAASCGR